MTQQQRRPAWCCCAVAEQWITISSTCLLMLDAAPPACCLCLVVCVSLSTSRPRSQGAAVLAARARGCAHHCGARGQHCTLWRAAGIVGHPTLSIAAPREAERTSSHRAAQPLVRALISLQPLHRALDRAFCEAPSDCLHAHRKRKQHQQAGPASSISRQAVELMIHTASWPHSSTRRGSAAASSRARPVRSLSRPTTEPAPRRACAHMHAGAPHLLPAS